MFGKSSGRTIKGLVCRSGLVLRTNCLANAPSFKFKLAISLDRSNSRRNSRVRSHIRSRNTVLFSIRRKRRNCVSSFGMPLRARRDGSREDLGRRASEIALRLRGFEPAIAHPEEAVTLLKGGLIKYRALVTDVNLKGRMDGWEIAKQSREMDPAFTSPGRRLGAGRRTVCPTAFF